MTPMATRNVRLGLALLAIGLATWQRACAATELPPDFDERPYLQAAFRYAERIEAGRWSEVPDVAVNREHPPLVKLVFAGAILATDAPEPDWERLEVAEQFPDDARPAFAAGRSVSTVAGIGQVALVSAVHPIAGLLLAVDGYHAKYTSQAYLDAIPGLLFALALFLFERATRDGRGARRPEVDLRLVGIAYALLGVAAAGKYPFGAVGLLAMAPLTVLALPRRPFAWLALAGAALVAFIAFNPSLWPDPIGRLLGSIGFHVGYRHSEAVSSAGLPWYQPVVWPFVAGPTRWHPGLFPLGRITAALLPLAVLGFHETVLRRPVWAAAALVGLAFLLVWPVKWPQYLLLVLVPLAVCAAHAPAAVARLARRVRRRRAAGALSG